MDRRAACSYSKCEEWAMYVVVLDGNRYFLCKKHYMSLLRTLRKLARVKGSSSLDELTAKRRANGIVFKS